MTRLTLLDDLRHDLVSAARSLRRQPGFTTAVVLTLAMWIGVNAAIFGAVSTYPRKPLPVHEPERPLAMAMAGWTPGSDVAGNISYATYRDIPARRDVLAQVMDHAPDASSGSSTTGRRIAARPQPIASQSAGRISSSSTCPFTRVGSTRSRSSSPCCSTRCCDPTPFETLLELKDGILAFQERYQRHATPFA